MKNKSKKNILVVAGMVMAIAGATIFANLTFIRRLMTYPEDPITNVDWYRPLATPDKSSGLRPMRFLKIA